MNRNRTVTYALLAVVTLSLIALLLVSSFFRPASHEIGSTEYPALITPDGDDGPH